MRSCVAAFVVALIVVPGRRAVAQDTTASPSLSLADAVRESLVKTPALRIADLQVREAAARARQTRAALLPNISAGASWVNQSENLKSFGFEFPLPSGTPPLPTEIGPFSVFDARASVSQTIFDLAGFKRTAAANAGTKVSEAARDVTGQSTAQRAAMAYLDAARAAAMVVARTEDVKLASDLAGLAQAQLDAGVSTALDVTRAKTQLAAARGALLVAQNVQQQADIGLARALGLPPSQRFTLTDTLSSALGVSAAPTAVQAAVDTALARRPELKVERERARRAELERAAANAEYLPRLDVAADWGYNGPPSSDIIATRRIAVAVTVPILDGFRRQGRAAEEGAAVEEARVREHDLTQQVEADVEGAALDLQSARQQESVASEQLGLAEEELRQARDRFTGGIAGNIDVINAQMALVHARDAVIAARYGAAAARVHLARATGVAETVH